jgi:hypothetical protein
MNQAEEKNLQELEQLNNESAQGNGIQNDINISHQRVRLQRELEKINKIKNEIGRNIILLREKRENKILGVDKLSFDNAVMLDVILKNFSKLKTILLE